MLLDGDIDEFKSYRHIQLHDDTIHAHTLEHSSYEQMNSHAWWFVQTIALHSENQMSLFPAFPRALSRF